MISRFQKLYSDLCFGFRIFFKLEISNDCQLHTGKKKPGGRMPGSNRTAGPTGGRDVEMFERCSYLPVLSKTGTSLYGTVLSHNLP